jgi:hypothetical protein
MDKGQFESESEGESLKILSHIRQDCSSLCRCWYTCKKRGIIKRAAERAMRAEEKNGSVWVLQVKQGCHK